MGVPEVRLLGPLEVTIDGRSIDVGGLKQRAVLAVLALAHGSVVPVDRLIDAVWGDDPPSRASNSLQVYISHLRRALEPDRAPRDPATVIVTQAPGYRLASDRVVVDVDRFAALVDDGSPTALDEALALWRGDPLAEFTYEEWATPEIRRLVEMRAGAVEARVALMRPEEAIPRLEQMVVADPTRERLWALLMLARWSTGQQAEALSAYQRARTALAEEVGVDPGPELREIESRILAHDATLRWEHVPAPPPVATAPVGTAAPPAGADDPFVGRAAERSRLVTAVERARAGRGGVVLVTGGPGAGKTRLCQEALATVTGIAIGWGRSSEVRAAPPHGPWRDALGPLAAAFDGEAGTDHGGDTRAAQTRLFEEVAATLARAAAERPRVVVLDDVHWADASSLALLAHMAEVVPDHPVLVVATYRDAEAERGSDLEVALGAISRGRAVERIALTGLGADDVGRLASALSGHDVDPVEAAALADRTGGNPFYVTEVVRAGAGLTGAGVPSSVRDVVRGRLARLPDSTRAVLEVAAIAGHGFVVDVVGAAAGLDVEDALDALDAALAADVVRVEPDGGLRFAHALIADAVAEDLTAIRRARLHARVATALAARPPGTVDPAEIAHHLFAGALAGTADAAVEASAEAARAAARRLGHTEAAALWSQAIAAVELAAPTDRARRARLLVERGRAAARAGDHIGQADALHEAMGLAEELGDDDLLIEAATGFGDATAWRWRDIYTTDVRTVAALERSLARLGPEPTAVRARVLSHLSVELDEVTERQRRHDLSEEALAVARVVGEPAGLARTLRHAILARFTPWGAESRVELAHELVGLAESIGDEESATVARFSEMFSLLELARVPEADALLDRVTADVTRLRLTSLGFQVGWYRACRAVLAGDLDSAADHAREARQIQVRSGQWGGEPTFALHHLTTARLGATPPPEAERWMPTAGGTALLARAAGAPPEEVRRLAWGDEGPAPISTTGPEGAVAPGDMFLVYALCNEVDLCHGLGEPVRAEHLYEQLLPWSGRVAIAGSGALSEGAVDHFLGLAADLRGDREAAERHLRAALALHEAIPAPLHAARTRAALTALGLA
jgi:DNA-binding SARP family transcriptional activator/tetratricopeptide (TPR) repeat protein